MPQVVRWHTVTGLPDRLGIEGTHSTAGRRKSGCGTGLVPCGLGNIRQRALIIVGQSGRRPVGAWVGTFNKRGSTNCGYVRCRSRDIDRQTRLRSRYICGAVDFAVRRSRVSRRRKHCDAKRVCLLPDRIKVLRVGQLDVRFAGSIAAADDRAQVVIHRRL